MEVSLRHQKSFYLFLSLFLVLLNNVCVFLRTLESLLLVCVLLLLFASAKSLESAFPVIEQNCVVLEVVLSVLVWFLKRCFKV